MNAINLYLYLKDLQQPEPLQQKGQIQADLGGGMCREDGEWSVWYSEADSALYHVKGSGGDGAHVVG